MLKIKLVFGEEIFKVSEGFFYSEILFCYKNQSDATNVSEEVPFLEFKTLFRSGIAVSELI